jgi:prolyl-tRNA synthetase
VHTPGKRTIEEVSQFLGVSPKNKIKTLAMVVTEEDPKKRERRLRNLIVLMRGDHQLNEAKLTAALGGKEFRPMHPEEIEKLFGTPAGYIGPVGIAAESKNVTTTPTQAMVLEGLPIVLADTALKGRKNFVTGANKEDYHLKNVTPERDFAVSEWADLRNVSEGEGCPKCGSSLKVAKAMEIGHIFKLGYRYSQSMGARVLDKDGKEVMPIMGSYGIGIERILTAAIEQNHDDNGFWLPQAIAPFDVVVTPTNVTEERLLATAVEIAEKLERAGLQVLLDDRDERPGVKFKDADLVGIPFRVTVGKKVSEGKVEVFRRSTRETHDATIPEIAGIFQGVLQAAG